MIVDNRVKYKSNAFFKVIGTIKTIHGKKWVSVAWSDGIILREHVDDLDFLE
jgi:hypothetical protein